MKLSKYNFKFDLLPKEPAAFKSVFAPLQGSEQNLAYKKAGKEDPKLSI